MGRLTPDIIRRIRELYAKYGSFSKVGEELDLDPRTVKKYSLWKEGTEGKPGAVDKDLGLSIDQITESIKLIRSGKVRNPNDLVLKGIPFDAADKLWKRVHENEGLAPMIVHEENAILRKQLREARRFREVLEEASSLAGLLKEVDLVKFEENITFLRGIERAGAFETLRRVVEQGETLQQFAEEFRIMKQFVDEAQVLKPFVERVKELEVKASGDPLMGLYHRFVCDYCGAKHLVAAKIKCTNCNHEV